MSTGDDANLKELTERYWLQLEQNSRNRLSVWRSTYVPKLLVYELAYMKAHHAFPEQPCATLVLLVGHSVEPLLQAICAYQPSEVVLVLSRHYGRDLTGEDFSAVLRDLICRLGPQHGLSERKITIVPQEVDGSPEAVFQALRETVRSRDEVVIDITGAKKSMVAGAFLYAAYANVPVSYVDFDDEQYNVHQQRPYGFASTIRIFANPYNQFALRDWERVQQLYNHYHFREAARLLESGILDMVRPPRFEDGHRVAAKRLLTALRCYTLWDSGDFRGASAAAATLRSEGVDFPAPTAVEVLGAIWPEDVSDRPAQEAAGALLAWHENLKLGSGDPHQSFYLCERWLIPYAEDELARIQRLYTYNEDNRSALLRSASLNEVLLRARDLALKRDTVEGRGVARRDLREEVGGKPLLARLTNNTARPLQEFWADCGLDVGTLFDLRNKSIHTYLSVPTHVAAAAWRVARANLRDFRTHWATADQPRGAVIGAVSWRHLSELCGTDAFLTPNLLD